MSTLVMCLVIHLTLAMAVPSPWVVPNLTLIGLVLAVSRTPRRWAAYALLVGVVAMLSAVRAPSAAFFGYVAAGAACRAVSLQWDANDRRVQWVVTGVVDFLLTLSALWLEGVWSVRLTAAGLLRAGVSVLCLHLVQALRKPGRLTAP
jgi:hypothetical protein